MRAMALSQRPWPRTVSERFFPSENHFMRLALREIEHGKRSAQTEHCASACRLANYDYRLSVVRVQPRHARREPLVGAVADPQEDILWSEWQA
jgi:hypothetical protein